MQRAQIMLAHMNDHMPLLSCLLLPCELNCSPHVCKMRRVAGSVLLPIVMTTSRRAVVELREM